MLINEVPFLVEEEEEPLEPLTMEHFILPLVIFAVGLVLSGVTFILEIIIKLVQRNINWRILICYFIVHYD